MRPRLLDLFCGEGGAGVGYVNAGFDVVGVDLVKHKRYPFELIQGDAIEYVKAHGHEFDAIHASPPCQQHSNGKAMGKVEEYACLIEPTRAALIATGKPYVIENVSRAPIVGLTLCGTSFGLPIRRHRKFECSFFMFSPECRCKHAAGDFPSLVTGKRSRFVQVCGRARAAGEIALRREAMQMPWGSDYGLAQAIPPAFTEFLGAELFRLVQPSKVAA